MKHIHYLMVIGLLSVFTIVNGKNMVSGDDDNNQQSERTMPKGRLLRVEFSYQGMRMEPFGNFDLKRSFTKVKIKGKVKEEVKSEFNFYRYQNEATLHDVPDTLFDAARRIIEEEHMYEYAPFYNLPPGEDLLDGFHWSFTAWFENGEILSSSGRLDPKGNGLDRMKMLLYNAAKAYTEQKE